MTDVVSQAVCVQGRTLHLRRLGNGPPVVLLHESPRSSAVLMPLATRLADSFTVFALDTPGYGLSEPLSLTRPNIGDFADAVADSLRALGLTRYPVYGTHTGATIAVALAKRHPDAVTGAVLDGYPVFSQEEADLLAYHYLPQFPPSWDGAHVTRLWSRVRDQYTFFPWNMPGRASRLTRDPPGPAAQQAVIRDFLASGSNYVIGYEGAFRFDAVRALEGVSVPLHVTCREDDLLFGHLDRLPALGANVTVERAGTDRDDWARRIGLVLERMIGAAHPPAPVFGAKGAARGALCALAPGLLARSYQCEDGEADPLILVHDIPGQAGQLDALARREGSRRRVIVPELPGAGITPGGDFTMSDASVYASQLASALAASGAPRCDLAGYGRGAVLAGLLAASGQITVRRLLFIDPPPTGESHSVTVSREPDWAGTHLTSSWFEARDHFLYRPASRRAAAFARPMGPGIDVAAVHARFTATVLAEPGLGALATSLAAHAGTIRAPDAAILIAGDHDNKTLGDAFAARGAEPLLAHYDDLFDVAADLLGRP